MRVDGERGSEPTVTAERLSSAVAQADLVPAVSPMLEVRGVSKSYGSVRALDGLDMEIAPGEIVGLVGPNGAGKTTLISLVTGLLRPDSGSITVNGIDVVESVREATRFVSAASQDIGIYLPRRVRHNLEHFGRLVGLRGSELAGRVEDVAKQLGLVELLDRRALRLSGGEKRRLHVAIALLARSPLLLLDEATTNVDVDTRQQLLEVIISLSERGTAICYSTHNLHEIEALDARVVLIDGGRVIASGSVDELVAKHGVPAIELTFDNVDPPVIQIPGAVTTVEGMKMRIIAEDGEAVLAAALRELAHCVHSIVSIDILKPSLESVYLTLRGKRYS